MQIKSVQEVIYSDSANTSPLQFYYCCGLKMDVYGTMAVCSACGKYITTEKHKVKTVFKKLK